MSHINSRDMSRLTHGVVAQRKTVSPSNCVIKECAPLERGLVVAATRHDHVLRSPWLGAYFSAVTVCPPSGYDGGDCCS